MIDKTKKLIEKAMLKHGDKFNYEKTEYKGCRKKLIITCHKHGDFEQTPENHLVYNTGCKECNLIERSFSKNNFIEKANLIHNYLYDYTKTKYTKTDEKVIIICKKHGEFTQKPNNHLTLKQGCPNCFKSKGSIKIKNILDINKIDYIQEMKFDDCRNKNPLPFDFYLPNYNICIEFDGRQHYLPIFYFGGEKMLNYTKNNDNIKNEYCLNNNIKLVRIPYYEINDIENIISSIFMIF